MPRVSAAHLTARRQQILDAAARCFARSGFHATSMQDVIAEAGLSVGAVYRYFRSKEELRRAVAEEHVGAIGKALAAIAHHEPALPLGEAVEQVLRLIEPRLGTGGVAHLALQMWAESLRDDEVAAFVRQTYQQLRANFVTMVGRAQQAGHVPADVVPEEYGVALFSMVPGYMLQRVLTAAPARATMAAGVRSLLGAVAR